MSRVARMMGWAGMISASLLMTGGADRASAREVQLAGIRLDQQAIHILDIYGVPHEVRIGAGGAAVTAGGAPSGPTAPTAGAAVGGLPGLNIPGLPGGGAPLSGFGGGGGPSPYGAVGGPTSPYSGMPMSGMPMSGMPMSGMPGGRGFGGGSKLGESVRDQMAGPSAIPSEGPALGGSLAPPGLMGPGGFTMPGMGPMPGLGAPPRTSGAPSLSGGYPGPTGGGAPIIQTQVTSLEAGEVQWVYRFLPDLNIEFTIDADGLVSSISLTGTACSFARTREGIRLGMNYRDVLKRYGWPDSTEAPTREDIIIYYRETNNIAFAFKKTGQEPYKVTTVVITRAE